MLHLLRHARNAVVVVVLVGRTLLGRGTFCKPPERVEILDMADEQTRPMRIPRDKS